METHESVQRSLPGVASLAVLLALAVVGALVIGLGAAQGPVIAIGIVLLTLAVSALRGLVVIQPNQAKVVMLFGRYTGTLRTPGLSWVNPFTVRTTLSLRVRSLESEVLKVNDATGNPVEIAAVINWRVIDTARAMFDVDDFLQFVSMQTESAIRHVAGTYAYDNYESQATSLRGDPDAVMETLITELQARLVVAGVEVQAARIRRLNYAPEIAGEMLRRQQANAIVAARQRIVEGAVGMVELALQKLGESDLIELDEDRKAAMVSNLMVVLSGDRGPQPIVNTGTIYP
ncbi:MAG TPA: SPFH domain-containing protein [Candidatus Dormibacteraeota bacterium]|jgi:regulator of protease activity HflC (stomatin/prohibitin superfamily)|nr:SPFH domain-containing protein [Candidatus Dormibacteraeota bacterium]